MSYIELEGVQKFYGPTEALKSIDFQVERHEAVCPIGASGSGKSTMLRCINALETINNGRIWLDGDVIPGAGVNVNALRRRIGIAFQSFNPFPHMTVLENLMIGQRRLLGRSPEEAKARSMSLLARVNMEHRADYFPDQLSGGQQQRIAIIRSIAMNPEVLLLDEVTSTLDPELVAEVLNIARGLPGDGMTMLLATHEMAFAAEVAEKVVFLEQGRILEQCPRSRSSDTRRKITHEPS